MELLFDELGKHVIGDPQGTCVVIYKDANYPEFRNVIGIKIIGTYPVLTIIKTNKGSFHTVRVFTKKLISYLPEKQFYEYCTSTARRHAKKKNPRVKFVD